ncbi:MAG: hypothetical protein Q4G26_16020 [Paracoccus sp. (in: a-proteobacteria)]|nr:hypothetical protein [Paracoccus sp. (in: a-proteobacteria)]
MASKTTRVRGFAPWNPQQKTLVLLDQVKEVLDEYRDHLPLTIRQIFYRMVGRHGYDKTENAYARLCETLNRARRAQLIDFWAIRDDGVTNYKPNIWTGVDQVIRTVKTMADRYTLDRQAGQDVRLFVLCEAGGMAPMLARVANERGVPVMSSGGFDSLTAKHKFAQELSQHDATEILHIGDHDPSGVHLFTALMEDIQAMCIELDAPPPTFTRLAVTPEQIEELGLPTAPPKATDRRSFEGETVQAEAIPPDVLTDILRRAIDWRQDPTIYMEVLEQEDTDREEIRAWVDGRAA